MTPSLPSLCELFAQAVIRCPDNLAVDHNEGCLTYRELEDASDSLASTLMGMGVGDQSPVILFTSHGALNIIAVLAILKTGGCWVPIDQRTWSPDMIGYVCNKVDSNFIVNTTSEPFSAPEGDWHILHYTNIPTNLNPQINGSYSLHSIEPNDPACIVFTSGSTGKPKGVVISHKSLCLYSKTSPVNLDIVPGDRFLHTLSVAFDASACMLFSTLANCGTVVPAQAEDILLRAPSCTVLAATPAILKNFPSPNREHSAFSNINRIILGGETATPDLLGSWVDAGVRVFIAYGATETTSMGTIQLAERDAHASSINPYVIGGVMDESPIWLADSDLAVIDTPSCEGEIFIGGDGVAQGYYKDEEKTQNSFIHWNGHRVYRTGDFGSWAFDSAGNMVMELRGRKDRTIKNRGFLVNLDRDVEAGLYAAGQSFGVTAVRAAATEKGIVAVVTPSHIDTTTLISKAKETMCSYCLPSRIGAVDHLPLSPNGKVHHKEIMSLINTIDEGHGLQEDIITVEASQASGSAVLLNSEDDHNLQILLTVAQEVLSLPGERSKKLNPSDSFLAVGGSSLLAFKLISVLGQNSLYIPAKELFKCQTFLEISQKLTAKPQLSNPEAVSIRHDAETQQNLGELRKQAIRTLGLAENSFDAGPLTSLQLDLALPTIGDEFNNINQVKIAYGAAQSAMMQRAWQTVWQSEPAFRSEVSLLIGCGALIVHTKPFRELTVSSHKCRDSYDEAIQGVSMGVGLGCTLDFIQYYNEQSCESNELTVILTIHHCLMDGESLRLMLDKVERVALGFPLSPSCSSINANLTLMETQRTRDSEVRKFFKEYLSNLSPEDHAASQLTGDHSSRKTAFFETSVHISEVQEFASQHCVSAACIYYIAWGMTMASIEDCSDVVVGAVVSNRPALQDHDGAIGAYMSTLPLTFHLGNKEETVAERIQKTMGDVATVGEYAWARSDQVGIGRRMRSLLSMQFPLPDKSSKLPALWTDSIENSEFPLCLLVESSGSFRMLYDSTQFNEETIQRLGQHFKHALYALHHETRVSDCMIVNRIQERVFREAEVYRQKPSECIVKQVLEHAMDQFPDDIALEDCIGGKLTYSELDKLTNIVAHHINSTIPNAKYIALYGDGTIGWILALLGTVKAGCIYVNLDPRSSKSRRQVVCEQAGATAFMIPNASQMPEAPELDDMMVLAVDDILNDEANRQKAERPPNRASPDDTLVVVFTSGTTGTPKGFFISNRSFLAMQTSYGTTMFAARGRRIAQFMSPVFDVCNMEIFSALLHGATLVLRDPSDPYACLAKVDIAAVTPSVMSAIDLNDFPNLEVIYACGEPVPAALVKRCATRALFYNAYGTAECTILTGIERLVPGDSITLGVPLSTVRVYILDENMRPVADGERGEVCVAGVQVLRGYINAPEQAARNILPDPWHPGDRMYRSGDAGSIGRDGRLRLFGRMDRLIKLRGFRVELAGVEHAILANTEEGISQCAALAVNGLLIAYVSFEKSEEYNSLSDEIRISHLLRRLRDDLLASSVPDDIVSLDTFPKTISGKIDFRELTAQYASRSNIGEEETATNEHVQSTSEPGVEDRLAQEWRQVLQLNPKVEFQESGDFFKLGGHSVSIMLLATRLTAAFGKKITVRELLPSPGFQDQVNVIKGLLDIPSSPLKDEPRVTAAPLLTEDLTEIEKQVWLQHQVATTVTAFNVARVIRIDGIVDIAKLIKSLNSVLSLDPIFRSNIVEGPDGPKRVLQNAAPTVQDVQELDIGEVVDHRFDLAKDSLMQVYHVRHASENEEHSNVELIILTSHVIADLGTLQNFLRLTSKAYSGETLTPFDRPTHLDSSVWTRAPSESERKFWSEYLSGHRFDAKRQSALDRSQLGSPLATFQGTSRTREFKGQLIVALNNLTRRLGITLHQMGLAVAAILLQWFSAEDDFIIGAPNAGRSTSEEQESLGQFLDRLPIRVTPKDLGMENSTDTTTSVLTRVRDSSLKALSNAIPFSTIIQDLGFPRGALQHPLFECMVTFHPRSAGLDNFLHLPDCNVNVSTPFPEGAKFPLMMEWFELGSDQWSLHIEHDTFDLPPTTVDMMENALEIILQGIVDECSTVELRSRLAGLDSVTLDAASSSSSSSGYYALTSSGHSQSTEEIASSIKREMEASLGANQGSLSLQTSFFSAGADSQAVVALRYRMQKLGLDIPVRSIFLAQSPIKLAEHLLLVSS